MYINDYGYMMFYVYDNGKQIHIREHKLNALINNSLYDVFNPDNVVHHKNGYKVDNRVENLEVMSGFEHKSLHNTGDKHPKFNHCIKIRKRKGKTYKNGFTWRADPSTKDGKRKNLSDVDLSSCIKKVEEFIKSEENTLGYTSYEVIGGGNYV